jgi:uncharacterized Zn-finger protein
MTKERKDAETCPRCKTVFSAGTNRAHPNPWAQVLTFNKGPDAEIAESALVACPSCGHRFSSEQVRFFGFLSARQIRWVFMAYIASFIAIALYIILKAL